MSTVKPVRRGSRTYHYLVQTYRWKGAIRKKQLYLGAKVPAKLDSQRIRLERMVWDQTWFREFDQIRANFQKRLRSVPRSVLDKERDDFVLHFTYDTNRIEGSSLSLDDTRNLLRRGVAPASKPVSDAIESTRHAEVLRRLIDHPEPVNLPNLLRWHRSIFGETKKDIAGSIRDYPVRIGNSRFLPPPALEVRPSLIELLRATNRRRGGMHPVERAGWFHLHFEMIHPFGDGNGRLGRLAMNLLLAQDGFPMINITYNHRGGYYTALEESGVRSIDRPFLHWFFLRFLRAERFFLERS